MKLKSVFSFIFILVCLIFFRVSAQQSIHKSTSNGLSLQIAEDLILLADSQQRVRDYDSLRVGWDSQNFSFNGKTLKFKAETYGEAPADGRSLYISMHGGGNAPPAVNDQQWVNQVKLTSNDPAYYHIQEGVVIVPRAPVNDWNMWFQYEMDSLLSQAIRAATLFAEVNPNKVYIMGYSAGGDGVYRLATRMAPYWAAASMSAGHPGEASPLNLRNIGFALNMGGKDHPYDRNKHALTWKTKLDSLQKADPHGYYHQVNIFEDKGHWMEMKDAVSIPFMATFRRNPYPAKVVWLQNSFHLHQNFYWLGISQKDLSMPDIADNPNKVIKVSYEGNHISIEENYANELFIYLNDKMVNLDKKITISYQGKKIFSGRVRRSAQVIQQTASDRRDGAYIFSAKIKVVNNAKVEL